LAEAHQLLATDVMFAELVFVLTSFYERPREEIAASARALLAHPSIVTADEDLLRRALELYELTNLHFVDAYLAAAAELTGVEAVASFDRDLDRIPGITRVEP
ncbi:MAG: PIN domain-containing protein, partial [Actinomycetota bacterium]